MTQIKSTFAKYERKDDIDQYRALLVEEMRQYYDIYQIAYLKQVNTATVEYMKQTLSKLLQDYHAQGFGVEKITQLLAKELPEEYGNLAKWRARRIAQTEVLKASNLGQMKGIDATGYDYIKVWMTGGRSKTERHKLSAGLHGQERLKSEAFDVDGPSGMVKMQLPGDPAGGAENVINCKCGFITKII
jgi:hypothetical protein